MSETRLRIDVGGTFTDLVALSEGTLSSPSSPIAAAPPRKGRTAGKPGEGGENLLNDEKLPPKVNRGLEEGDVVTIKTRAAADTVER